MAFTQMSFSNVMREYVSSFFDDKVTSNNSSDQVKAVTVAPERRSYANVDPTNSNFAPGIDLQIFSLLSLQDTCKTSRVSKRWNILSNNPLLWSPGKFSKESVAQVKGMFKEILAKPERDIKALAQINLDWVNGKREDKPSLSEKLFWWTNGGVMPYSRHYDILIAKQQRIIAWKEFTKLSNELIAGRKQINMPKVPTEENENTTQN